MNQVKVKIKVFSDSADISLINSSLRQIQLESIPIAFTNPNSFIPEADTIYIFQIDSLDSKLLSEVIDYENELSNKIIIVIRSNNALLVSTIAKSNLSNIFVFPYEIAKFTAFIGELISNGLYKTIAAPSTSLKGTKEKLTGIIGSSPKFERTLGLTRKVAEQGVSNILLLGETGSGKGLLAKAIHLLGKNSSDPFVDIICTSLPENLLESELFGFEAGAFTSAKTKKPGLFELAGNGTLFLDEIGDMSFNLQAKLLRAIEKKVIKRLGGTADIPVKARIISATNRNIEEMIEQGIFRRDLYHRLNVVTIELPPLREREDDIIILADNFIEEFNKKFNKSVKRINRELKHFLLGYSYPGNVRELRNSIERAVLLSEKEELTLSDFSTFSNSNRHFDKPPAQDEDLPNNIIRLDLNYGVTDLRQLTKYYAEKVLEKVGGNKSQAAKLLKVSRPKLDTLIKKKK